MQDTSKAVVLPEEEPGEGAGVRAQPVRAQSLLGLKEYLIFLDLEHAEDWFRYLAEELFCGPAADDAGGGREGRGGSRDQEQDQDKDQARHGVTH